MIDKPVEVTKYREVRGRRTVKVTRHHTHDTATVSWTRRFDGKEETFSQDLEANLLDGKGAPLGDLAREAVRKSLDSVVAGLIDAQAVELRAIGDAATDLETKELAYLRVVFLARPVGAYFKTTYAVEDEEIARTFDLRKKSAAADRPEVLEALPEVHDVRRQDAIAFARDRKSAFWPPALSHTQGSWYNTDLGAMKVATSNGAGGGASPVIGFRFGTPVLARLHGITDGFLAWDDASIGGDFGYMVTDSAAGSTGPAVRGTAMYTLALGARLEAFQVLAGARAEANAMKIGDNTGHAVGAAYYGMLGVRLGGSTLTAEAWYPTGTGDDSMGAQLYLAARVPSKETDVLKVPTAYASIRVDTNRFDACAAMKGDCVDVPDLRVWTIVFAFGAAFR